MEFIQYMIQNKEQILSLVTEHIELTAIAVAAPFSSVSLSVS